MSTHGDSQDTPPGKPSRWDPDGDVARATRARQVEDLVAGMREARVPVEYGPEGVAPEEAEFFYAAGWLLAKDEDVARVREALDLPPADGSRKDQDTRSLLEAERLRTVGRDQDRERTSAARGRDRPLVPSGITRIEVPSGLTTLGAVAQVAARLGAGVATPDHVVHVAPKAFACPATEPLPTKDALDPPPAADASLGRGVRVVVIDTGLVPELAARTPWLEEVTGDEEDATRVGHYRGHGTFIAGLVRTMAPACEVDIESFMWFGGGILESDLVPAMLRALDSSPDIISMSAGATTYDGRPLLSMEAFWQQHLRHRKGTVLVCAAGNNGNRGPFWPATFPWTVAVGALDADGRRADYSNHGSWVDVWARGSDVVNAYPDGDYTYAWPQPDPALPQPGDTAHFETGLARWSGTSFATPLVAGMIAARMSWSGESARDAATALLKRSLRDVVPGVGAVLAPGMADAP